ncbi:MAG: TIGR04013 family B12-binding domain/radical SAM domain-containing protein [Deltaproteobacteria bacterium]|nr:TIGR04013 family B12-binding domain/radical SAM domain-containing protein [Deltaproteobacteria bacterium]
MRKSPICVLRETPTNRYSVNVLVGLIQQAGLPWVVARSGAEVVRLASGAGRAFALYSFMTPDLPTVRAEVAALRPRLPGVRWLAGGAHPTADPEGTLAMGFDHVVVGEAERVLGPFLRDGDGPSVLRDPDGGPPDLDPYPARVAGRPGPVEITRGCRGGCRFCSVGRRRVRHRGLPTVVAAARAMVTEGRRVIRFVTPDALAYGGGLKAVADLLAALRTAGAEPVLGAFPSEVRPERVTPEAVALLRTHCHNRTLVIGGQSGSDRVLRFLGRGHTVDDVVQAAARARRGGLRPHVDLIFGIPGETSEEQAATVELARLLQREHGAKIHAHYFHPLPGTPLWGADPTPLDPKTRAFLERAERAGTLDGDWRAQIALAQDLREWASRGWIRAKSTSRPDVPTS